jgi:hypothetical protein
MAGQPGTGPGPSGPWPVRIRLDRVAHRLIFLRISRRRLDRVFVGLRVGDRRLFRFGGLRTRRRDGLFGHAKKSRNATIRFRDLTSMTHCNRSGAHEAHRCAP